MITSNISFIVLNNQNKVNDCIQSLLTFDLDNDTMFSITETEELFMTFKIHTSIMIETKCSIICM